MIFTATADKTKAINRSREGAWIEIAPSTSDNGVGAVAPARERGLKYMRFKTIFDTYGRSREGAWIEI